MCKHAYSRLHEALKFSSDGVCCYRDVHKCICFGGRVSTGLHVNGIVSTVRDLLSYFLTLANFYENSSSAYTNITPPTGFCPRWGLTLDLIMVFTATEKSLCSLERKPDNASDDRFRFDTEWSLDRRLKFLL